MFVDGVAHSNKKTVRQLKECALDQIGVVYDIAQHCEDMIALSSSLKCTKTSRVGSLSHRLSHWTPRCLPVARKAALVDYGAENRTRSARRLTGYNALEWREPRMKVAVDVDEVLGQFLVALNNFCRERYGMGHCVEDYHVYHFATVRSDDLKGDQRVVVDLGMFTRDVQSYCP